MKAFFQEKIQTKPETLEEKQGAYGEFVLEYGDKLDFDDFVFVMELYFQQKEDQVKLSILEKERVIRKEVMDEHLHNCKNVTFPKTILSVAKELSRGESLREKRMAQDLMYAFVAQMRMETDAKLLKLKLETSESGDFVQEFRKFLGGRSGATIVHILKESLMLCLYRILMTEEEILEEYALSHEKSMDELKKSFWNETISPKNNGFDVVDWFSQEIYPFHLEVSSGWNQVFFMQQGCAFVYVAQILTNLLINAMNYGKKSKEGEIFLGFNEKLEGNTSFFTIKMKNPVEKTSSFLQSTGYGIHSLRASVARLNNVSDLNAFTRIQETEKYFTLEILIPKNTLEMEEKP